MHLLVILYVRKDMNVCHEQTNTAAFENRQSIHCFGCLSGAIIRIAEFYLAEILRAMLHSVPSIANPIFRLGFFLIVFPIIQFELRP